MLAAAKAGDVVNFFYILLSTLISVGIIARALRKSFRRTIEEVVDERIAPPIQQVKDEIAAVARSSAQTATDVAILKDRSKR